MDEGISNFFDVEGSSYGQGWVVLSVLVSLFFGITNYLGYIKIDNMHTQAIVLILAAHVFLGIMIGKSCSAIAKKNDKNEKLAFLMGFLFDVFAWFYYVHRYAEKKPDFHRMVLDKKYQWILAIIIFLIILSLSTSIRLSNWDLLTDSTTGGKIPLALDPYYFLRVAETFAENDGSLPPTDVMRGGAAWHPEIMPKVIFGMWKVSNIFGDYSLRAIDIFSPVAFYFIGLIIFFFLVTFITKSKLAGLLSSGLLAFSPVYLYRTMTGFADHESIGMVSIFAVLLFYLFALKNFEKGWKNVVLYGLGLSFFTSFVLACWGGGSSFVIMMIPFTFLIYWIIKNKDKIKGIVFYLVWYCSLFWMPVIFGPNLIDNMIMRLSATYGLLVPAVLGFMLIDWGIEQLTKKGILKIKKEKHLLWVVVTLVVLGSVGLTVLGKNIFGVLKEVWHAVLFPFGTGRVGLTVAENAQPYLNDWIGQGGSTIFWLFIFGTFLLGIELGKFIRSKKHSLLFGVSWIAMISAMLFSRISSSSLFNGENFISQIIYLAGVGIFVTYFIWLNMHKMFNREKTDCLLILMMALMFVVVLNGRSAVRTFFLITPFVLLSVGYFTSRIFTYAMKSKDEIFKIVLWGLFLFALASCLVSMNAYREGITGQAQSTGPGASAQWQGAMSWVRNNTEEGSKFAHWWDYGYWVQTLGERPSIADGGHFQGYFDGNERIGRYILTTDKPASAYSLMKTQNISYLLIDPTDLGKYAAYSKIGSDDDWDRFSMIPVGFADEKNTQETANETTKIYQLGGVVDEDINYNGTFLPGPTYDEYGRPSYKAYVGGIILKIKSDKSTVEQPEAVYMYNGAQYRIPLRYIYVDGKIHDFGSGLNGTLRLIPAIQQTNQGMSVNQIGAGIYLSPRTGRSLFAKMYLMDDPFNEYEDISLAYSQDDPGVKAMKAQGADIKDFVYYQGFRGPIKIWDVDYPEGTPVYEEFTKPQDGYGDMDWRFE